MKNTMIVTDTLSSVTPELAGLYGILTVPYHIILDGKDYPDDTYDRNLLFARLESYQELPTTSACSTGDILEAYRKAGKEVKDIIFIAISSLISASYNAALQARNIARKELPDIGIEVIDCKTAICGQLLVVLAAARAAKEGKVVSDIVEILRRMIDKVTYITVPESMFFFERAGRSDKEAGITGSPVVVYPIVEIDSASGGVPRFLTRNQSKAEAIERMLDILEDRIGDRRFDAAISYTNNPDEANGFKNKLISRFKVSREVPITPHSTAASVVSGPRALSLAFHSED
jgi:DegV family protein with EDD domain